ncbi:MAG: uracil-DNA glycosylase [Phycisphaerae bacterium]|nr:uracil-DNA glycosylase [Phycisphaerae bacterium]
MDSLATEIRACRACEGLNIAGETQAAPGYGSPTSPVVFVGQSLCRRCMDTQIPFTGGSGRLLDRSLEIAGISKQDVFTTNVVHCHPPDNRASHLHEIANCRPFLRQELKIVKPRLIIGLGQDARTALASEFPRATEVPWPFEPPPRAASRPYLLFAPHPSWVMRQPQSVKDDYVSTLAQAVTWSRNC